MWELKSWVHRENLHVYKLYTNPNAFDYLTTYEPVLSYSLLSMCQNDDAVLSIPKEEIIWINLSANSCPAAIHLLKQNVHKIDWYSILRNSNAIDIILDHIDYIETTTGLNLLSSNTHPKALEWLTNHPDYICWDILSANPGAEELFLLYPKRWHWNLLSTNPCIFTYNYKKCRTVERTTLLKEELIAAVLHPDRISNYLQKGYSLSDF